MPEEFIATEREREVLMSGIGGQGVQLAAQVLARAAMTEGRDTQLFGSYGGMMRGGNTDATVVIATDRVEAPPTVQSAWSAVVMHPQYAEWIFRRIRPSGVVVVNTSVVDDDVALPVGAGVAVVRIDAGGVAIGMGNPALVSMVALGAFAAATGIVAVEALVTVLTDALPAYRAQHLGANADALRAGAALAPVPVRRAWCSDAAEVGAR